MPRSGFVTILSMFLGWTIVLASEHFSLEKGALKEESPSLRGLASVSEQELMHCYESLKLVANENEIGQNEFILFLEDISGRSLEFDGFYELPLSLVLIFYTAACYQGRDCSKGNPAISLDHVGPSSPMLTVFCSSVKDVAVVQIDYSFQYKVQSEQTLSKEIKTDLVQATQRVLLDHFGCEYTQRRVSEGLTSKFHDSIVDWEYHLGLDQYHHLLRRHLEELSASEGIVGLSNCDYTIQARITDTSEFRKFRFVFGSLHYHKYSPFILTPIDESRMLP